MSDFDVVFLLLSTRFQGRFDAYLNLHDFVFNAGYHTSIATSVEEVYGLSKRWRVVVIDGSTDNPYLDVYAITAAISNLPNEQAVVFVSDFLADHKRCHEAGADVCVYLLGGGEALCKAIRMLEREHNQLSTENPERIGVRDPA